MIDGKPFHDLHHANGGEFLVYMDLTDAPHLIDKIKAALKAYEQSNGANGLLDFRDNVAVILAKETGGSARCSAPCDSYQ